MRLAVVGKGGVGKTTMVGTLARLLARRGRQVLAVDLDPNPGLALTLGLPVTDAGLPDEALEQADPKTRAYGWQLAAGLSAADAVERYSVVAPDGVRFLSPGKIDRPGHSVARSLTAVRQVVKGLDDPGWDIIADIEAGTTTPYEGYHDFAERVLIVVTPGWTSVLTAQRLIPILGATPTMIVGSRFAEEHEAVDLTIDAYIPYDERCAEADRLGRPPLDHCPDSPAVAAIDALVDRLVGVEATV